MFPFVGSISVAHVIAYLLPIAVPFLTDWWTKATAPRWLKTTVALFLSCVSGAVSTVILTDGEKWQTYVLAILYSAVVAFMTHYTGVTQGVQNATANVGLTAAPSTNPPGGTV